MPTLYTTYTQHSNSVITVTNTSELNAALANLSSGGGGTILLDGNGGPYDISANGLGDANNPILIKAVDANNPPLVENIYVVNSSHIAMTELDVNSTATSNTVQDLRITNSDHIEFVGNAMSSDANGYWDGSSSVTLGGKAALIRNSSDINFSNNTLVDYNMGVSFLESTNVNFSDNELVGLQGDGFRAGGIQNAVIDNNYMHDFYGSLQSLNHTDFIQIWSTNTSIVTSDVEISNNVLDTNGGASSQGIFIGNEQTRHGGNGQFYQNIKVHDNVVHTASWHGISMEGTIGAQVYDNAVLFDDQAHGKVDGSSPWIQSQPFMAVTNSTGPTVYGNISGKVNVNGVLGTGTNNQILNYSDPATAAIVDNFMANLPNWTPLGGGPGFVGGNTGGASNTGGGTGTSGPVDPGNTGNGTDTGNSGGSTDTGNTGGTGTGNTGGGDTADTAGNGGQNTWNDDDVNSGETGSTGDGGYNDGHEGEDGESDQKQAAEISTLLSKSVTGILTKFSEGLAGHHTFAVASNNTNDTMPVDDFLDIIMTDAVEQPDLDSKEIDDELALELF